MPLCERTASGSDTAGTCVLGFAIRQAKLPPTYMKRRRLEFRTSCGMYSVLAHGWYWNWRCAMEFGKSEKFGD